MSFGMNTFFSSKNERILSLSGFFRFISSIGRAFSKNTQQQEKKTPRGKRALSTIRRGPPQKAEKLKGTCSYWDCHERTWYIPGTDTYEYVRV